MRLDQQQIAASAACVAVLAACLVLPAAALLARSEAQQSLQEKNDQLARVESALKAKGDKVNKSGAFFSAPSSALLHGQTRGQASAEFEAYISRLAAEYHAILISSSVQQAGHKDPADVIRIQVALDTDYEALQKLLYKLEAETPYVFVDGMILRTAVMKAPNAMSDQTMKVTLNLKAIWQAGS